VVWTDRPLPHHVELHSGSGPIAEHPRHHVPRPSPSVRGSSVMNSLLFELCARFMHVCVCVCLRIVIVMVMVVDELANGVGSVAVA